MSDDLPYEIRSDVFPHLGGFGFGPRESNLRIWIREAYQPFSSQFSNLIQFVDFINRIQQSENAERFIRYCQFYGSSKNWVKHPFTKLIMMLSIIESIISMGKTYKPFKDWIMGQDKLIESHFAEIKEGDVGTFKQVMEKFKEKYHSENSSTRNVIEFFHNYFTDQDKVKIIKSFRYKKTDVVSRYSERLWDDFPHLYADKFSDLVERGYHITENDIMSLCYNWRNCYIDYGSCHPDSMYCMLKEDEDLLFRYLKRVINIIYTMRSNFVHDAKFPPLGEKGIDFMGGIYKGKSIIVELNIGHFEELFEKGFLKYFQTLMEA